MATQMTRTFAVILALFGATVPFIAAQRAAVDTETMLSLPDSPGAMMANSSSAVSNGLSSTEISFDQTANTSLPVASPRVKTISAGRSAPPQTVKDKIFMGLRESVTPLSMAGWITSAGYGHLVNGRPNYGTNSKAFAQRLGASAADGGSKEIFSDCIMAPILHQDPRYYQLGRSQSLFKRALYASTRPLVGRTDGAAALTQTYYPPPNQSATEVFQAFGTSVGGSAIGYLFSEFRGDIAQILHISKHE
jgi:hypothetical protein